MNILGKGGDISLRAQALIGLGNAYAGNRQNMEAIRCFEDVLNMRSVRDDLLRTAQNRLRSVQSFLRRLREASSKAKKPRCNGRV